MAVSLSALHTGRSLPPGRFLVFISVPQPTTQLCVGRKQSVSVSALKGAHVTSEELAK
jgi:hypothetical protein